ncbi:uncharacterized protein LOC143556449 [Bidens hawaiensis]|uniref:uncharacterized protein LOC143556449 n=1 Tax=Bidens hawaiensis TaxID=980011 RepID=UPI00404930A8
MEKKTREYLEISDEEAERVSSTSAAGGSSYCFYDDFALRGIRVHQLQPAFISCSFTVPPRHSFPIYLHCLLAIQDRNGDMAMGAIANFIDEIGGALLYEKDAPMKVSVDMSISYLSTAKVNDELEISAKLLGGKGAYNGTLVLVKNKASGQLIAEGRHSLFSKPTSKI